jgi:hypothetical protein
MSKKTIAYLIESELEKAEVVIAAKGISDSIQKIAETVAKIESNDLMPLSDPIREQYGAQQADSFYDEVSKVLRELTEKLSAAKNSIGDSILRLQGEEVESNDLSDMDDNALDAYDVDNAPSDLDNAGDHDFDATPDAPSATGDEGGSDASNMGLTGQDDQDLDFSGNHAGRNRMESADHRLAKQYIGMVRDGQSPRKAAKVLSETYGISTAKLLTIMEAFQARKR